MKKLRYERYESVGHTLPALWKNNKASKNYWLNDVIELSHFSE